MAKRSSLRASDADRERVAERLKQASTEGRILAHELEDRLGAAFHARTYGDLDAVVADLPGARMARRSRSRSREFVAEQPLAAAVLLVVVAISVLVMAAVVVAGLLAFSGVWMVLAILVLVHRSGRAGGRPPYYGGRPPHRGERGRGPGTRGHGRTRSAPWIQ